MLLLLIAAALQFFVSFNLGLFVQKGTARLLGISIQSDLLGTFLLGLIASTVYFNLFSFWLPVNYWTLLPLLAVAIAVHFSHKQDHRQLLSTLRSCRNLLAANPIPSICFLLLLLLYWIKPSTSPDGATYHSNAIAWYEMFKVVPGLGNLHGRFAFNPASFIIEAAWSFTSITGQSIYSLNGLLTILFLGCIFTRVLHYAGRKTGWVYLLLLLLLFRPILGYMSSATSDILVLVCSAYALLRFFDAFVSGEKPALEQMAVPLLITLYAPVAKITAFPLALVFLFVVMQLPRNQRRLRQLAVLALLTTLIYLPWLARNYIMSGYFAYPVAVSAGLHPDWQIPRPLQQMDYLYSKYSCRSQTNTRSDLVSLSRSSFGQWFIPLMEFKIRNKNFDEFFLITAALFSPLLWLLTRRRPMRALRLFWLVTYIGFLTWLVLSTDPRFGTGILLFPFIIPLLAITLPGRQDPLTGQKGLQLVLLLVAIVYYAYGDLQLYKWYTAMRGKPWSMKEGWILPAPDAGTYIYNKQNDFPFRVLSNGVKLYYNDSTHSCQNAPGPCQIIEYGWEKGIVEPRGPRLEDGFKTTRVIDLE